MPVRLTRSPLSESIYELEEIEETVNMRDCSIKVSAMTILTSLLIVASVRCQCSCALRLNQSSSAFGPPPATAWNRTYGGPSVDEAYSLVQTSDGGYAIGGFGLVNLVKTNPRGEMVWNKTYGGDVRCVLESSDSGFAIAGGKGENSWLVKTESSGNVHWERTYGGSAYDFAHAACETNDGGYILAGVTESYGAGGSDFYLVKTDANGNMEWNKTYGGASNEVAWSVLQSSDGGYLLVGETYSFGVGGADFWLVKTDSGGNVEWTETYGTEQHDSAQSVLQIGDGGYVVVGYRNLGGPGQGGIWLIKTDGFGSFDWHSMYLGPNSLDDENFWAYSVQQTVDRGYIICGARESYYAQTCEAWLIKVDENGAGEWWKAYGGEGSEYARSIVQTSDGGYAFAGFTSSYGAGGTDFWLVKILRANPPVARFTHSPDNSSILEKISFSAQSSYDLDGDIVSYLWDFGDGNTTLIVDPSLTHTYSLPGIYNVTLTVMDSADLNSSVSQTVWVRILTKISVSSSRASTFPGVSVDFVGKLSDVYGNSLRNDTVVLYSSKGSDKWIPIGSDNTNNLGSFLITWTPTAVGYVAIRAEWVGNQTFFPAANTTDLNVKYIHTDVSLALSSSTSLIGFRVEMNGNLTSDVGHLSNIPILLSYSVTGGVSWNDIMQIDTTTEGTYFAVWLPVATGNYLVRVAWNGNSTHLGDDARINLAVIPFEEQKVFSVVSNSTVSDLTFNSSSRELHFISSGFSGTVGHITVYIAESLIDNIVDVKAYMNGTQTDYIATQRDNTWQISLLCPHSTQAVVICLGQIGTFKIPPMPYLVLIVAGVAAVLGVGFLVLKRKRDRTQQ